MSLEEALSTERLSKYVVWASGNHATAIELYTLNLQISEALYVSLQTTEITLRNSVHNRMVKLYGNQWFQQGHVIKNPYTISKVQEAENKFTGQGTAGQIVAELTFGFWTSLFAKNMSHLWGQDLRPIFDAGRPLQRKEIAGRLNEIRTLRNRIAHHEPIIQRDLLGEHTKIREILGWLSIDALQWCDGICRFPAVHPNAPIIIGNLKNPTI